MVTNKTTRRSKSRIAKRELTKLAGNLALKSTQLFYVLPYYTRDGGDTEYLISNPNNQQISATLAVFGKRCELVKKIAFKLESNCTRSFRLNAVVPDHVGHSLLIVSYETVGHILYLRKDDVAIVGAELAGRGNVLNRKWRETSRTYGFGYRAAPLGQVPASGDVYVSNPLAVTLTGTIVFYDQRCRALPRRRIELKPGCTIGIRFPAGRYGYARIQTSGQAAINVLHFHSKMRELAAAELIGEEHRLSVPPTAPAGRSKILLDHTHRCFAGFGLWSAYDAELVNAGLIVSHHTAGSITAAVLSQHHAFVISAARDNYDEAEKQAIVNFVNSGGGLMIIQEHGTNTPWGPATREMLNLFGANDDNNFMEDALHCFNPGQIDDVVFDAERNFFPHPILAGVNSFHVDAAPSLSGDVNWTTIVETDDDAIPARRPALMVRPFGAGRVIAFCDTSLWVHYSENGVIYNDYLNNLDNKVLAVRCAEWLLFRI